MLPIDVGSVLGPVELQSVIRKDATSTVFAGHHARLDAEVTVRVMRGSPTEDRDRFQREVRTAARLRHPALVRVLDFGEFGDARYIVTQPIRGTTLEHYLAERKDPPSESKILTLLIQVADTLRTCHRQGVAHRDLSPSSLLRDLKGNLKVLDVGFVPSSGAPARGLDGSFAEPSPYLPPEFAQCEAPIPASADIFALGVIAYELAFRCLPFDPEVVRALADDESAPAPRFDLPTHCSSEFVELIERWIAPEPHSRVDSAEQLIEELHKLSRSPEMEERGEPASRTDAVAELGAREPTIARTDPGAVACVRPDPKLESLAAPELDLKAESFGQTARRAAREAGMTFRALFYILADQRHEIESLPPAVRRRLVWWGAAMALGAAGVTTAGMALILS